MGHNPPTGTDPGGPFYVPAGGDSDWLGKEGTGGTSFSGGGGGPNLPGGTPGIGGFGATTSPYTAQPDFYGAGAGVSRRRAFGGRMGPALAQSPGTPRIGGLQPFQIPQYAMGGTHPGGPAIVGEEGPEMVNLPAGSSVTPNPATLARMGDGDPAQQGQPDTGVDDAPLYALLAKLATVLQPAQLLAILRALASIGGDEGGADAGGVPAYAYGTPDQSGRNYTASRKVFGMEFPSAPQAATTNRGEAAPNAYSLGTSSAIGPTGHFSGPQLLQDMQFSGIRAGAYDPLGSEPAFGAVRDEINRGGAARERQAALATDFYGGDPAQRAYGQLMARLNTQSDVAGALGKARADAATSGIDFSRNVYLSQLPSVTRKDPRQPNAGDYLAGVAGEAIGAAGGAAVGNMGQKKQ